MNKIYRVVWNSKHLCWQAVSEITKGGIVAEQTSIKTESRISLGLTAKIVTLFAVNVLSASIALAGPTGGTVSSGTATITAAGTTTTINQSTAKAAIDWNSFSTNANETVNFVQPNANAITLNRVVGSSASTLNGQLNANGQVFIINPNGILFGSTSQVNTAGLVASTLNLTNGDFNNNLFNFSNASNNKTVENRGKITVPTGGTVALIAPTVKHTGTIKAPQGNVLLAAGGDVTLSLNNGSLLGYTINQGKAQALINSGGMIQADGGKVVLTAKGIDELSNAVVNSVGVVQAQTVNNVRGIIELGSDLESGTVNVGGVLDASAPNGGNGGQIRTSAADVHINAGTTITTKRNTTTSLPPTTSGWELKAKNIDVDFFGGTVSSTTLSDALNKGNVTLSAVGTGEGQGSINLNDATSWNANTALTINAVKDIDFNGDLDLSGDKAKLVMNYGSGSDYNLNNGSKINISGSSPTLLINGQSYIVINSLGEEGDANINTLQGMNNNLTGNYALGSNIDASDTVNWNNGSGFDSIGKVKIGLGQFDLQDGTPFQGNFHGLGHTIDSLTIQNSISLSPDIFYSLKVAIPQGLFSVSSGDLRDVGLTNVSINAYAAIGALSGYHLNGNIKNVYSTGQVKGGIFVGGVAGITGPLGMVKDSFSNASTTAAGYVGGLIGVSKSPVYNSYATGNIALPEYNLPLDGPQIINPTAGGGSIAGGLIGVAENGIYNSYATGNVFAGMYVNGDWHPELGFNVAGGLVGALRLENSTGYVDQSYATGDVSGNSMVGGLVGMNLFRIGAGSDQLYINRSYATGDVAGNSYVGGIVGRNTTYNIINNSYATGQIQGGSYIGGLAGDNSGIINNSYSTGKVIGVTNTGGLIGDNWGAGIVTNSYWNTETSGQLTSAGGVGKTTAELKQIMTFAGWDIADATDPNSTSTWVIDEDNTTPWLRYNH